jgi:spermidine/putrescine-binding protein
MSIFEEQVSRREAIRLGAAGTLSLYLAGCGGNGESSAGGTTTTAAKRAATLNWLTWQDHWVTKPDQLSQVKAKTKLQARPQLFSDNSDAYLKVKQTGGQFDVVSADAKWVTKYFEDGLIESFDLASIPTSSQLYSVAKDVDFWKDGSNYLGYPFGWSSILIFYNPKYVNPAPTSWEALLDPKYKGRISIENQPTDVPAFAGAATSAKDPFNMTPAELKEAGAFLKQLKPNVLKLVGQSEEAVRALADESVWMATGNLGYDVRVKEAGGPKIDSVVPSEGTVGWADTEMKVKASKNKDVFAEFIGAMEQAEYVAANFLANGRPLFNEKAYKILVDQGHKERADRFYYNEPEKAFEMNLKGPSADAQAYIDTFNEVFGA